MKKILFMAIAAICVVAGCKKNPVPVPEDDSPVAVQFSTRTIDASVTRTKAAVDDWTGTEELHIFGFAAKRSGGNYVDGSQVTLGSGRYNLAAPFIDGNPENGVKADSPSTGTNGTINVYNPDADTNTEPFYYDVNTNVVYDFYGYYFGNATVENNNVHGAAAIDVITYPVTINGTQDLLYATTDKATDVEGAAETVTTSQAYGAWAARRGVQPTLNFKHALSQFKFEVKRGRGSFNKKLTIQSIQILGSNKGKFTVVGSTLGYVQIEDTNMNDSFTLQGKSSGTDISFTEESTDYTKVDGLLMIAPNQDKITVKVTMHAENYTPNSGIIESTFELPATKVSLGGANVTKFEEGKSYTVKMVVYGPEQVEFEVSLAEWTNGGTIEYDPDNNNNGPAA